MGMLLIRFVRTNIGADSMYNMMNRRHWLAFYDDSTVSTGGASGPAVTEQSTIITNSKCPKPTTSETIMSATSPVSQHFPSIAYMAVSTLSVGLTNIFEVIVYKRVFLLSC